MSDDYCPLVRLDCLAGFGKRSGEAGVTFHATESAAAANRPPQKQPVAGGLLGPSLAAGQICYRTPKTPFLALQGCSREQEKTSSSLK